MDQQNQQNLTQHRPCPFLKKITKLMLSVSVFSFLFSYYYSSNFSLLHSTKFYLSSFPLQLLTHSLDKNCIFLIFNAILVLLAKSSSWGRISSTYNLKDQLLKTDDGDLTMSPAAPEDSFLEKEVLTDQSFGPSQTLSANNLQEQTDEEGEEENLIDEERSKEAKLANLDEEHDNESEVLNAVKEESEEGTEVTLEQIDEESREELESGVLLEEEEKEENELLSAEELNKKFDEFIRKMKEELRIEARQQLVMV